MTSKFYCVKKGRKTGIFTAWSECKEYTYQFSGAIYKSFTTKEDADKYMGTQKEKEKNEEKTQSVVAYTDGSCDVKKTKTSGASCIIIENEDIRCIIGKKEENSTNNRGELFGVLLALKYLDTHSNLQSIKIITDSQYAINQSLKNWKATTNLDILNEIWELLDTSKVTFEWVKGHNKDKYNEMADQYANYARKLDTDKESIF